MRMFCYDLETFPNVFTIAIADIDRKKIHTFEISFRKDDRFKLFKFLSYIRKQKGVMVGFNNIGFDYPVLHFLADNKDASANRIYKKAMAVIEDGWSNAKFKHEIKDKDQYIKQVDLFKIHHFDNVARMTSLKMLEFNMLSKNIEDLPFDVGLELTSEQIDVLLHYNKHDVRETVKFFNKSEKAIAFRQQLSKQLKRNFMNHNDTKIGKDFFIMKLQESMPECCYKNNRVQQTHRDQIHLKDCILPYIKFERPEFQSVLDWLNNKTITETKGVFSDILEADLGDVAQYANMRVKRKRFLTPPKEKTLEKYRKEYGKIEVTEEVNAQGKTIYWINWKVTAKYAGEDGDPKKEGTLNVVVDGLQYDFGTGGIHGALSNQVFESDDEYVIKSWDVASYYPNLAIKNRVYPEHLSETFCDIYEEVFNTRKKLKAEGKDDEQQMMKLALNGVYGDSNNKFSPFYDPKYTMTITINGQLSLCMLAEQLLKIDGLKIIMINTDGLEFIVPRKYEQRSTEICQEWEALTKLTLEGDTYEKLFLRDVNNYIGVFSSGKIKCKGAYVWDRKDLGWHQNHSSLIVKKAAYEFLVNGIPVRDTIEDCDNMYDFMSRTKVPRSSRLILIDSLSVEHPLQNICRYYVSKGDDPECGELVKVMPPKEPTREYKIYEDQHGEVYKALTAADIKKYEKVPKTSRGRRYTLIEEGVEDTPDRRIGIDAGWNVRPCNDVSNFKGFDDIDYDYYVKEAEKLIKFAIEV